MSSDQSGEGSKQPLPGKQAPLSQEALHDQEEIFEQFTLSPFFHVLKVDTSAAASQVNNHLTFHETFHEEHWEQWKQSISASEPKETYKTLYRKAAWLFFLQGTFEADASKGGIRRPGKPGRLSTIADIHPLATPERAKQMVTSFLVDLADICRGLGLSEDVLRAIEAEVKKEDFIDVSPKFAEFEVDWKQRMLTPPAAREKDAKSPE